MDRDRIERRDFPTGRRGYDPAAVDEHLRRVADEFEARAHAPGASLSDSTSEQVRLILRAAEDGAAQLRAAAGTEASDHVTRVQTAADGMLSKLDALESELTRLLAALRDSGERLVEGLADLQAEASAAVTPPADERRVTPAQFERIETSAPPTAADDPTDPRGEAEPAPPVADATAPAEQAPSRDQRDVVPSDATPQDASPQDVAAPDEPQAAAADAHDSPPLSAPGAPDWPAPADALFADEAPPVSDEESEDESARLVALNMALNGSPRDDTRAFLAEHFALPDIEALLDDVYARAGR